MSYYHFLFCLNHEQCHVSVATHLSINQVTKCKVEKKTIFSSWQVLLRSPVKMSLETIDNTFTRKTIYTVLYRKFKYAFCCVSSLIQKCKCQGKKKTCCSSKEVECFKFVKGRVFSGYMIWPSSYVNKSKSFYLTRIISLERSVFFSNIW